MPEPQTEDEYIRALREFDWYYSYSDDHRVYVKWTEREKQLMKAAKQFDPDFKVWARIHLEMCPHDQ